MLSVEPVGMFCINLEQNSAESLQDDCDGCCSPEERLPDGVPAVLQGLREVQHQAVVVGAGQEVGDTGLGPDSLLPVQTVLRGEMVAGENDLAGRLSPALQVLLGGGERVEAGLASTEHLIIRVSLALTASGLHCVAAIPVLCRVDRVSSKPSHLLEDAV